jgi:hypothetical protein
VHQLLESQGDASIIDTIEELRIEFSKLGSSLVIIYFIRMKNEHHFAARGGEFVHLFFFGLSRVYGSISERDKTNPRTS